MSSFILEFSRQFARSEEQFKKATTDEDHARALLKEAEKLYSRNSLVGSLEKTVEALKIYHQIGLDRHTFRVGIQVAILYAKLNDEEKTTEYMNLYVYPNIEPGQSSRVGDAHVKIGEIFEANNIFPDIALKHYENALTMFERSDRKATQRKMLDKIASLKMCGTTFMSAFQISHDDNLMKFGAKMLILNAVLCFMNEKKMEEITNTLQEGLKNCYRFSGSREEKMLQSLVVAWTSKDSSEFHRIIAEYSLIVPLDKWQRKIVDKIQLKMVV